MEIVIFLFMGAQTNIHYKNMSLKYIYKMSVNTDLASERCKENNIQQNALEKKTNVQTHTHKSAHNP